MTRFPCPALFYLRGGIQSSHHRVTLLKERADRPKHFLARWDGELVVERGQRDRVVRRYEHGKEYWLRKSAIVIGDPRAQVHHA